MSMWPGTRSAWLKRRLANDSQSPCHRLCFNMCCLYRQASPQTHRFTPGHSKRSSANTEPSAFRIGLSICWPRPDFGLSKITRAGGLVEQPNGHRSQLSFHSLRHTAVSLLKDAGIPQAVVQELVGHDSEQMSALYTHVGREAMERAAAALPEI